MSETLGSQGGLSRRSFLKTTAALAGATTLAGGAAQLTGIASVDGVAFADSGEKIIGARCMWAGCENCQQNVHVRDGHMVKVETVPNEPWGNRVCLRGRGQIFRVHGPNRLKYPMKRASWTVGDPHVELRGKDEWERISWDEAISLVSTKWNQIIDKYGSQAIASYSAVGNSGFLSTGLGGRLANIMQFTVWDSSVDLAVAKGMQKIFGGAGYFYPCFEDRKDIMNAKRIMVWGSNVSESFFQGYRAYLDAQEAGAEIMVVDPSKTTVAGAADWWIPINPATDSFLLYAICKYLIDNEKYNPAWMIKNTNATLLVKKDEPALLRMSHYGVEPRQGAFNMKTYTFDIIDPCFQYDLDAQDKAEVGQAANPALTGSWTIDGFEVCTAFDALKESLKDFTLEKAEQICGVPVETTKKLADKLCDGPVKWSISMGAQAYNNGTDYGSAVGLTMVLTGQVGFSGTGTMQTAWFEYVLAGAQYARPTGTMSTRIPILIFPELMESGMYLGKPWPIKCMWCYSANYLSGCVDANGTKKALDGIELMVTQDVAWSDTVNYSDIVLPAAHSYENEDIEQNPSPRYLLHTNKCVEPPYECKTDADIVRLIAHGIGVGQYFTNTDEEDLELLVRNPPFDHLNITLDRLRKERGIWLGNEEEGFIDTVSSMQFSTDSGKLEIFWDRPTPRANYGQQIETAAERLPRWREATDAGANSEARKKYPIICQSERARYRLQTIGFENILFTELEPEPTVRLNPDDAAERGIKDGDRVELFNDRGSCVAVAQLSACHPRGVCVYPKGLQAVDFKTGSSFSCLSSRVHDAVGVNSSFLDVAVEIRLWDGSGVVTTKKWNLEVE